MPRIDQSPRFLNQFGFGPLPSLGHRRPMGDCPEMGSAKIELVTRLEPDQIRDVIQRELGPIAERLARLEEQQTQMEFILTELRDLLIDQRTVKNWYSPAEVAAILGKRPYTVREWCRLQRVNARKRPTGRGDADEWEISHEELERIQHHGLLPIPTKY